MGKPNLVPLSTLISLPEGMAKRYLEPLRETLAVIDSVHRVEPRSRLTVTLDGGRPHTAEYKSLHRSPGKPAHIRQYRSASEPHMTFAHELAHFIDNRLLHPLSAVFASSYDDLLVPLLEAISLSPQLVHIQRMLEGHRPPLSPKDRKFLRYLLESQELFARTYAQFIAGKSNHPAMEDQLRFRQGTPQLICGIPVSLQWDSHSFEPIMNAMESMLRLKGWS